MIITLVLKERKIKFEIDKKLRQNPGSFNSSSDLRINKIAYSIKKKHTAILEGNNWIWKSGESEDFRVWTTFDIVDYLYMNLKLLKELERVLKSKEDQAIINIAA